MYNQQKALTQGLKPRRFFILRASARNQKEAFSNRFDAS